jgi:acyl-[acyl carrier protein]--UDP-N-acetylglucosamine O-acyltransferase
LSKKILAIYETSIIDDNVTIGEGTKIWHFSHVLSGSQVGKKCNMGQNVVISPEVTIGDNCKIQNNVSIYDVPDYALVVGNPARQIGWMCTCGERIDEQLHCTKCGKAFKKGEQGLEEIEKLRS